MNASFSLKQLLMGVALAAILLAFTQTEGCGQRFTLVECVSFSPSGSRLVVSRLDARDSQTPLKRHKANVSRTISLIDASDGSNARVLNRAVRLGNRGTGVRLWRHNRASAACLSEKIVVAHEFGGGPLALYATDEDQSPRALKSPAHPVLNIIASHDGSLVAASGWGEISVTDVETDRVIQHHPASDLPFLGASLLSFSPDDARLAIANDTGVHLLDISPARKGLSSIAIASEQSIEAIAFFSNGSLLAASSDGLRQYHTSGSLVRCFSEDKTFPRDRPAYSACAGSHDGRRVATSTGDQVEVYDALSGKRLQTFPFNRATCLAFAADTANLAVGDGNGCVSLIDTDAGRTVWTASVPGRYRPPWTVPGLALLVWCCVAYRLFKKGGREQA